MGVIPSRGRLEGEAVSRRSSIPGSHGGGAAGMGRPARLRTLLLRGARAFAGSAVGWPGGGAEERPRGQGVLGDVAGGAVRTVETPLASGAGLGDATSGSPARFKAFIGPSVGTGGPFRSVSLWAIGASKPRAVVGAPPSAKARAAIAGKAGTLNLIDMLGSAHPSVGFQYRVAGPGRRFAVFSENPLPANRRSALESNSAFAA